ncbi:MAG: Uncharacterized protein AUREO_060860 [Aureobasidium pullulans]|uniref:Uncharacterized protein n=2 Tax=Aureobasidium pullulans TaxID=5580 RepID=A0A1A7MB67_AURPU|nr:MAG: Uncharacterized protein AUREO_060860 [Aureobasidium pullulans]THW68497.1 hypothetical protein D6D19_08887 [Aureobasidium pullulans]THZ15403.1 hypothetical protein D6C89_09744 [Aureobasidium pullulans]TIA06077.1 hypothetical protein D6C81_10076 [Aureobasidium pullulans]TIA71732.1 hypothetical protein D6C76_07136 [Aureobasidium pullulans]
MTSRSHKKIASAGTSKPGKAVNLARPVRATRRSEPETSESKSFTSGYTDIRELLLSLATEESAEAPVIIEDEDEDAESSAEDEVDQASNKAVDDANNDPDDYQKSLKTFGNEMAATSAGRTAGWIKSLDVPHSSLKRKATRSPSPARSTHRLHFDTASLLFVPEDEVSLIETAGYSDQTHTPATPAADDYYSEPSPTPSPHPRDETVTAGKDVAKGQKDTLRANNKTMKAHKTEKQIAAEAETARKEAGTAREAQEKSNAKSTPDQTAMVNIALFVNAINATHPTHPENTATNPPRSGNAAEKFSAVANQMLNRQRTFVESFETWERETYDPGAYDPASTRALRTFIHGLRDGVDEMQGYADDFDTLKEKFE